MKQEIETNLQDLIGQPMIYACRAADMLTLGFGELKIVKNFKGEDIERADYVLHIQCPWRIVSASEIIVGDLDRLLKGFSANSGFEYFSGTDWDRVGVNLWDKRMFVFIENEFPLIVQSVQADFWGGFKLFFERDYVLEVIPMHSSVVNFENWRFFEPGKKKPHFVVVGNLIEAD